MNADKIIHMAIDEFNELTDIDSQLSKTNDTVLFGSGTVLDSLGLVNLITAVEQSIEDSLDVTIELANERAMSRRHSPFKTVGSLVAYVEELLEDI